MIRALEVPELNGCVILDTSVLIDLERGAILETIFCLPFNYAVPSLLYRMELKEYGGDALMDLGLRLEELDTKEVALAQSYSLRRRALSVPDTAAAQEKVRAHERKLLSHLSVGEKSILLELLRKIRAREESN